MENNYFESVEVCPYCDNENVYPMRDVNVSGYVAVCEHCGAEIMLCDECYHSDDNQGQKCDWCATKYGGKCFRGPTNNK